MGFDKIARLAETLAAAAALAAFAGCGANNAAPATSADAAAVAGLTDVGKGGADTADTSAAASGDTGALAAHAGKNGSRLHAVALVADGATGDPQQLGVRVAWYDTKLGMECAFMLGADGSYRCRPTQGGGLRVYSTPTCAPGTDLMALLVNLGSGPPPDCNAGYIWHGFDDLQCPKASKGTALKLLGRSGSGTAPIGHFNAVTC